MKNIKDSIDQSKSKIDTFFSQNPSFNDLESFEREIISDLKKIKIDQESLSQLTYFLLIGDFFKYKQLRTYIFTHVNCEVSYYLEEKINSYVRKQQSKTKA